MQTFVPFPSLKRSLMSLDKVRLANQRRETLTLLNILKTGTGGWRNHPACKMWQGHEGALAYYGLLNCKLWIERGGVDNSAERMLSFAEHFLLRNPDSGKLPRWWGDDRIHLSHRSNLARKDPFYLRLFPDANPALPYVWPTKLPEYSRP